MQTRTLGKTLTGILIILGSRGIHLAADPVPPVDASGPAPAPQVAPRPVVLPQDVPKIEVPAPTSTPLVASDQEFLTKALAVITAERELGKLATERAETEEAKALGRELLTSQVKNGAALQELAKAKNFALKMPLENPHQESVTSLQEKSGADFDSTFREHVAQDRSKSIQLFADGAKSAKDPTIRALSYQMLAELKKARPLAAVEAAKSARNSREISKVALKPQPAAPAQAAPAPQPVAVQEAAPAATSPAPASTVAQPAVVPTAPQPAVAPAPPVLTPPATAPVVNATTPAPTTQVTSTIPTPPAAGRASAVLEAPRATVPPVAAPPVASPPAVITAPAPAPAQTGVVRRTVPATASQLQVTSPALPPTTVPATRVTTSTAVPATLPSSRVVVSPSAVETRGSTVSPVLEGPVETRSSRTMPATTTRRAIAPARTIVTEGTQYIDEPPRVITKKPATVTVQEAPRPRVIRRANGAVVEERTVIEPAPRKVIRRKLFSSDDDDEDVDDD